MIHIELSVALARVRRMPSIQHEALVEMFRQHPGLAALVLRDQLGVRLPAYQQVRPESADLNDTTPTERRADAIVTLLDGTGAPALGVVVEIQLRPAEEKRRRWPFYLAKLWMRLGCPVMLLVVCANVATARWCATGIEMGHPGLVLHPLVYGPDQVPVVTDVGQVAGVPEPRWHTATAPSTSRFWTPSSSPSPPPNKTGQSSTLKSCSRCCPRRLAAIGRSL